MPPPPAAARVETFRRLHAAGCFVMPNPWDVGGARVLAQLGFPALATTSAGFAWSRGARDNHVRLDDMLAHMRDVAQSVDVPVNADFEGGFAVKPEIVAAHVRAATDTGVAGLSIEDSTGDAEAPLFDRTLAVERIRAARQAIDRSGTGVLLTGRSEGFIVGRPDLDETVARLVAYAGAGADCVYAPGIRTPAEIATVVQAVAPTPVNLLVYGDFITVAEAAALGVRRISVGGALARAAWTGLLHAAREIADHGTFSALSAAVPSSEINPRFPPRQ
jgi:2-methylisocitrate lyase-like PEP mutase family enzyme